MPYVDGYVLPVSKKKVSAYRKVASKAAKLWRKHGALEYHESVGDDLKTGMGVPFTSRVKAKPGETVVFAWATFKNRAHRDKVNKKVFKDPGMKAIMEMDLPFNARRMAYGGFKELV